MLVSFASSIALVFAAATAAGATTEQISSWVWAISIGSGVSGLALSWWYKTPIITAWSTPGAALLITALSGYSLAEAIGAFAVSSLLMYVLGVTGLFAKFMDKIPQSIGAAMLAGILLNFGTRVFASMQNELWLPLVLLVVYLLCKRFLPRYTMLAVLFVGIGVVFTNGQFDMHDLTFSVTEPVFVMPEFSWSAIVSVSLPLCIVTMTSQNLPGVAVLRNFGYHSPTSTAVATTSGLAVLLAPFGCFSLNYAAITAAICMTEDVHPDKDKRYLAGIWTGVFYIVVGIFGATVAVAFNAFPEVFVATLAGLALFTTIGNSLHNALNEDASREAAVITFLTTASGVTLWNIGAAFWGIVIGLVVLLVMRR